MKIRAVRAYVWLAMVLSLAAFVQAAEPPKITHDWPAYYGPNGTYADLTKVPILDDLSRAELVWTSEHADLGFGKTTSGGAPPYSHHSGSSDLIVYRGLVIQSYFNPKNNVVADDILLALDAATGQTKWKQVYADEGYNRAAGKHVQYAPTPAAYDGNVFYLGSGGRLHCVEVATGKRVWDRDIEDYPARFKAAVAKVEVKESTKHGVSGVVGAVGLGRAMQSPLAVVGGTLLASGNSIRGFDPATGEELWKTEMPGMYGGGWMPAPVTLEGVAYALYAAAGKVRLLDPRTGKVLWTEERDGAGMGLGIPSGLVAGGRLFLAHPNADKKRVLTAFGLSETGMKLQWQAKEEFKDPGYFAYRDGIVYYNDGATRSIRTYKADDGALLCNFEAEREYTYWAQFHLWGDRLVLIGDHCHESIISQCSYAALTPGCKDLKASGGLLYPRALLARSEGRYIGVCGYAELWSRPVFVDGYLFTRGINKESDCGVIFCWDLRALSMDKRVTAARDAFAKGKETEAVSDLTALLKDDSRRVRAAACRTLAKLGRAVEPATPAMVALLSDWWQPDGKDAFESLVALGTVAEKAVLAAVDDPSADVRKQAWQILTTVTPKSDQTIVAARKAAVEEKDGKSQQSALDCLVSHGEAAVPTLMAMLEASKEECSVGLTVLGMLGDKAKSALPTLTKMLESNNQDTYRYALVAAIKVVGDEKLPDSAERGLKEAILNPGAVPRDAKCDFYQAARHLQRFGIRSIPVFVEACQAGARSQDWRQSLRAAYGLSLYGKGAKDELAVLEETLKAFSGHKDYRGCIKPPLDEYMEAIREGRK